MDLRTIQTESIVMPISKAPRHREEHTMSIMTQDQADHIHARTVAIVAKMRADADAAEARGDLAGATALRTIADSRERAGNRARAGARIGRA